MVDHDHENQPPTTTTTTTTTNVAGSSSSNNAQGLTTTDATPSDATTTSGDDGRGWSSAEGSSSSSSSSDALGLLDDDDGERRVDEELREHAASDEARAERVDEELRELVARDDERRERNAEEGVRNETPSSTPPRRTDDAATKKDRGGGDSVVDCAANNERPRVGIEPRRADAVARSNGAKEGNNGNPYQRASTNSFDVVDYVADSFRRSNDDEAKNKSSTEEEEKKKDRYGRPLIHPFMPPSFRTTKTSHTSSRSRTTSNTIKASSARSRRRRREPKSASSYAANDGSLTISTPTMLRGDTAAKRATKDDDDEDVSLSLDRGSKREPSHPSAAHDSSPDKDASTTADERPVVLVQGESATISTFTTVSLESYRRDPSPETTRRLIAYLREQGEREEIRASKTATATATKSLRLSDADNAPSVSNVSSPHLASGANDVPDRTSTSASTDTPSVGNHVGAKESPPLPLPPADGESLEAAPDLHWDISRGDWSSLHSHVLSLLTDSRRNREALGVRHPHDSSLPLHAAVWRAPPALVVMMVRLTERCDDAAALFSARDDDGNTPLHLCAANPQSFPDEDHPSGKRLDTTVLDALTRAAPGTSLSRNREGDVPLHLLASSPELSSSSEPPLPRGAEVLVDALARADPDALAARDDTGATPCHAAAANRCPPSLLRTLATPTACATEDHRGLLPLHYAAAVGHAAGARVLADAWPAAVAATTRRGDAPAHLAARHAAATCVAPDGRVERDAWRLFEALLVTPGRTSNDHAKKKEDPLRLRNRDGLTPLHVCALFDAPAPIVEYVARLPGARAASAVPDHAGATPLHLALARDVPAVAAALTTPEAAAVVDAARRLPLHVAVGRPSTSLPLLRALIRAHPRAVSARAGRGRTALHLAVRSPGIDGAVVAELLRARPAAAAAADAGGDTPLHGAVSHRAAPGVVKLLLDAFPAASRARDARGNLPLHRAAARDAPRSVVERLAETWPNAASEPNDQGDTPTHLAAAYGTDAGTVRALLRASPGAVLCLNDHGQTPTARARANRASPEITRALREEDQQWDCRPATADDRDQWGFPL